MRPNPLRERWARGEPASCLWIDIGWPVLMLPTNNGQSYQALVDTSKTSGAT